MILSACLPACLLRMVLLTTLKLEGPPRVTASCLSREFSGTRRPPNGWQDQRLRASPTSQPLQSQAQPPPQTAYRHASRGTAQCNGGGKGLGVGERREDQQQHEVWARVRIRAAQNATWLDHFCSAPLTRFRAAGRAASGSQPACRASSSRSTNPDCTPGSHVRVQLVWRIACQLPGHWVKTQQARPRFAHPPPPRPGNSTHHEQSVKGVVKSGEVLQAADVCLCRLCMHP